MQYLLLARWVPFRTHKPGDVVDGSILSPHLEREGLAKGFIQSVEKKLDDYTVAELDALASAQGLDVSKCKNKAQKLKVIKAAQADAEAEGDES